MKSRMVITEQAVFQPADADPTAIEWPPFVREIDSAEAPFARPRMAVGPEWKRLDPGWLADDVIGMCFLRNDGEAVVEIGNSSGWRFARVRPRESCRFEPCDGRALCVRCEDGEGESKISYVLYPA